MQIKNWEYQNLQFPFHYLFFCTTKVSRSWVVSQLRTSRYSWSASSGEMLIAKNWDDPSTLMNHSKLSPIKPASATSTVTNWLDAMLRRIGKIHKCCILSCCCDHLSVKLAMPWSSVVLSWTRLSTVSLTVTLERAPPVVALFTWTPACTGKSE